MNKKGFTKMEIAILICIILVLIIGIGCCVLRGWAFATYKDTPITEIPAWVWFMMQGT